jgi:class 3 adenylate cyclase
MKDFLGFQDGDTTTALVCFTDIAGFTRTARSLSLQQSTVLLKRVSSIISEHVGATTGKVVKYIGDASLLVFPEEGIDASMLELLSMKGEIDRYFESDYPDLSIVFSAHIGQIMIVRLVPIDDLDILGDTVNRASLLGNLSRGGGFVISEDVYQRLTETTRRRFHRVDTPVAYTAD